MESRATQKAERKAAAAKDSRVFEKIEFGHRRIPSFPVKLALGLIALLSIPVVFVYGALRTSKQPR